MFDAIRKAPGRLLIRPRAEWNAVGATLTGVGIAIGAAVVAGLLFVDDDLALMLALPGLLLAVGVPLMLIGRRIVVDLHEKAVLLPSGRAIAFHNIGDIHLGTYVKSFQSQHGRSDQQRYRVGLITKETDPTMAAALDEAREKIDAAVAEEGHELAAEDRAAIQATLAQYEPVLTGQTIVVADHGDELRAWTVAERLAKTIGVPMLDFCGDQLVERTPAELDLPLGTRMARLGVHPDDPGPKPDEVVDESNDSRLRFSWPRRRYRPAIGLLAVAGALALVAWVTGDESVALTLMLGAVAGLCVIVCFLILGGRRVNTIEVDETGARYGTHVLVPRLVTIPITALELVRVNTTLRPSLNLVSDDLVVRCPMSPDAARWMQARIEKFLYGKPTA